MGELRAEVTVASGASAEPLDAAYVVPHQWTSGGIAVVGGGTGAHLLLTAVAGCVLNDVYREAGDLQVEGVRVDAGGVFDTETWSATVIDYAISLAGPDPAALAALGDRVAAGAEVPQVVQGEVTVIRR